MDRRAPNMTEFLANLNAPQENPEFNDLSLFETTEFLNLDFGEAPVSNDSKSVGSSVKEAASPDQWMSQPFLSSTFQTPVIDIYKGWDRNVCLSLSCSCLSSRL
jgi:hypothetical protein